MESELINDIVSTSIGGAVGGAAAGLVIIAVQGCRDLWRDWRDSERVFKWLQQNSDEKKNPFRTTRAIASYNDLTEDRVRFLCSHDSRIKLSTGREEDRWSIYLRNRTYNPASGRRDEI